MIKKISLKEILITVLLISLIVLLSLYVVAAMKNLKQNDTSRLDEIERFRLNYEKQIQNKAKNILTPIIGKDSFIVETSVQMQYNFVKEVIQIIVANKKEIKERNATPGEIKRINVSIAVDRELTEEEDLDLRELISAAVGLDVERKDKLTIRSIPFDKSPINEKQALLELYFLKILPTIIFIGFLFACLFLYKRYFSEPAKVTNADKKALTANSEELINETYELIDYNDDEITKMKEELISAIVLNPIDAAKKLSQYAKGVE